jgi:regulator of protease activity HflC (stomatin/prohibitin superfamily)
MLFFSNLVVILLLSVCIFLGYDKLYPIDIFLAVIFLSEFFNKILESVTQNSLLVTKVITLSKNRAKPAETIKFLKISYCFIFLAVWLSIISEVICLAGGHGLSVYDSFSSKVCCACIYLVLYFYSIFAIRTLQSDETEKTLIPEAQPYRMLQYLSIYQLVFGLYYISVSYMGFSEEITEKYLLMFFDYTIFFVLGYLFCLLMERILDTIRILTASLKNKTQKFEVPFFISLIASSRSFKGSLIKTIEFISGVDLSKSEIAGYILNHIEPVSIIALIVFWLISSVVIVPPSQEAIFYRMGKITGGQSYKPGLHFKLPWPFEKMELFQPNMVKTLNIGFTPDETQKNIIWAKAHAKENFSLLVGNGVEIIAVDCQVFFKVNNLYKYITKVQNPETYIESLTYKLLTDHTVSKNFDQIISQNRNALISDLKAQLQTELNQEDMGVTVVDIVFLAIHPPLEVASVYEDVISAQVDKQTTILKANSESIKELCMKKAFAEEEVNNAKAYAQETVANAIGEAVSFESRIVGYNTDPDLEEFRLKLDYTLKLAKSKNLYVIDKSFMRQHDRIMLNLQN